MAKLTCAFYYPRCGYYEGARYRSGVPLYQRKKDKSFFIIEDGKRVNVGIVNANGTVVKLRKEGV